MPQAKKRRGVSNQSTRKIIGGASRTGISIEREIDQAHVPKMIQKKPIKKATKPPMSSQKKTRGGGPSKYMEEIIRLNIVELIHNYDRLQTRKRIEAVFLAGRSLIKEVDEEDLDVSSEFPCNFKQTEGEINNKLD
jgi:hypothetical protein